MRHQSWYLNSACSHHMTGERSMFQDIRPKLEGNKKERITWISKHLFHSIDNVLFVEGLKHNLLSISQLCDIEYDVSFNKGEYIVRNSYDLLLFFAKRYNNLYKINLTDLTSQSVTYLKGKQVRGSFESKTIISTYKPLE
ncbi:hypothetical protein CR513_61780, partial [Mucuna pruriens]